MHPVIDEPAFAIIRRVGAPDELEQRRQPISDLASSSPLGASAAKTSATERRFWVRMACTNVGLSMGMPGT